MLLDTYVKIPADCHKMKPTFQHLVYENKVFLTSGSHLTSGTEDIHTLVSTITPVPERALFGHSVCNIYTGWSGIHNI